MLKRPDTQLYDMDLNEPEMIVTRMQKIHLVCEVEFSQYFLRRWQ